MEQESLTNYIWLINHVMYSGLNKQDKQDTIGAMTKTFFSVMQNAYNKFYYLVSNSNKQIFENLNL